MRAGFLMDPLESIRVDHDSTFALMLECRRRGVEVRELRQEWLWCDGGEARSRMRIVEVRRGEPHFEVRADADAPLADLDVLFLRKDPPVDVDFVWSTLMVDLPGAGPFLVNWPRGLREANEKLFALRFPQLMPPTVVSREIARLAAFLEEQRDGVVKPLDGCGGQGVYRLRRGDPNFRALLETATRGGRVPVMAQAYLPAIREGDKRIILLDGEPLGAVLRVPQEGELRANLAAGGAPRRAPITARDREICRALQPELRRLGLWLTGIDVIGGYLTEVNVTSPTGLVEIDRLDGKSLEVEVMDWVCARGGLRAPAAAGM